MAWQRLRTTKACSTNRRPKRQPRGKYLFQCPGPSIAKLCMVSCRFCACSLHIPSWSSFISRDLLIQSLGPFTSCMLESQTRRNDHKGVWQRTTLKALKPLLLSVICCESRSMRVSCQPRGTPSAQLAPNAAGSSVLWSFRWRLSSMFLLLTAELASSHSDRYLHHALNQLCSHLQAHLGARADYRLSI